MRGIREDGDTVGKESTPDAQAALAPGMGGTWIWRAGGRRQEIAWDGLGETEIRKSPGLLSDWNY